MISCLFHRLVVEHDRDLYQENDAFVCHHDDVRHDDCRMTLDPEQYVRIN